MENEKVWCWMSMRESQQTALETMRKEIEHSYIYDVGGRITVEKSIPPGRFAAIVLCLARAIRDIKSMEMHCQAARNLMQEAGVIARKTESEED